MRALDAILERYVALVPLVSGTTLFAGNDANLPATKTGFVSVRETGGGYPIGTHNGGFTVLRRPEFQITARASDYRVAVALMDKVYGASNASDIQIGDLFFLQITPTSEPFDLPPDASGRSRVALNVATIVRQAAP